MTIKRVFIVLALGIFDLMLLQVYVAQNQRLPFRVPEQIAQRLAPVVPLPTVAPIPAYQNILIDDTAWQGNTLVGSLTNHNDYPVATISLQLSASKTKDPWKVEKTYDLQFPIQIESDKTTHFSYKLTPPDWEELWWTIDITDAQKYRGEALGKLPTGLRISQRPFTLPKQPVQQDDGQPWGVAKQLDDVTWTVKLGQDDRMATPQETLDALNVYRQRHGAGTLSMDDNLSAFARERARYLNSIKSTDKHEGFKKYIENEDNVKKLGFWSLGENAGYGYKLIGVHQIEWVYAADEGHNKNQLDSQWSHVGIGIEGLAVVFIFGGNKI